tara:strand:- start:4070 stop:4249 length:180 start_codon:yes stop_codon:yes gene_type:complete
MSKDIEYHGGVQKNRNGSYTFSATIRGYIYNETYYLYNIGEARRLFRQSCKEQLKKVTQ